MYTYADDIPEEIELKYRLKRGKAWYSVPDGELTPCISTVIPLPPELNKFVAPNVKKNRFNGDQIKASQRHVTVNRMCADSLTNDGVEFADYKTTGTYNKMLMRFKRISNIRGINIPVIHDDMGISGKVGCVADYNKVPSVIDFRVFTNAIKGDEIEALFLHNTAYAIMYNETYNADIDSIVIIVGSDNGAVPQVFKRNISDRYVKLCKHILKFYEA